MEQLLVDSCGKKVGGRLKVRLYHSACVVTGDKQAHFGYRFIFKLGLLKRNRWNTTFKWLLTPSPVTTLWQNPALPTALQDSPLSPYFISHISVCYHSVQFHGPTKDCFVCPPCTEFRENRSKTHTCSEPSICTASLFSVCCKYPKAENVWSLAANCGEFMESSSLSLAKKSGRNWHAWK